MSYTSGAYAFIAIGTVVSITLAVGLVKSPPPVEGHPSKLDAKASSRKGTAVKWVDPALETISDVPYLSETKNGVDIHADVTMSNLVSGNATVSKFAVGEEVHGRRL